MRDFLKTVRRHWRLLLVPPLIAAVTGGWFTFGAAKTYRSTANLWVDGGPANGSSLSNLAYQSVTEPPAQVVQSELTGLLDSNAFDQAVGEHSSLLAYLSPLPGRQGPSPSLPTSRPSGSEAYALEQAIHQHVSSTLLGPNVLSVAYVGPTPAVSRSVVSSVLSELQIETRKLGPETSLAETRYDENQLAYQQETVSGLRAAAAAYLSRHPGATAADDVIYSALVSALRTSKAQLSETTTADAQAVTLSAGGATPMIRVVDDATVPVSPVKSFGNELSGVLAGAFAGVVLSLLVSMLLMPKSPVPWDFEPTGKPKGATAARYSGWGEIT